MEIIRKKRVFALAGIILLVLGTWLPYYQFTLLGISTKVSAWGYWEGKIILVITLASALFIFKDFIKKYIPQLFQSKLGQMIEKAGNPKASLIPTVLIVAFLIYMYITINADMGSYFKNGLGFYVLWLGAICLVIHAFVYKPDSSTESTLQAVDNVYETKIEQPQAPMTTNNMATNGGTSVPNPQTNGMTPGKKYCPQCGNQVDESASFCFMCGHKF